MKKGMKLIVLAAFVCTVLSCGMGVTSGGKNVPSDNEDSTPANEDEVVFTGSAFVFSHDKNTGIETKVSENIRNLQMIFRANGTYTIKGQTYKYDKNKGIIWTDIEHTYKYKAVDGIMTTEITPGSNKYPFNRKYSYDGTVLIIKPIVTETVESYTATMFVLSSKIRASFIPLKTPALSIPS